MSHARPASILFAATTMFGIAPCQSCRKYPVLLLIQDGILLSGLQTYLMRRAAVWNIAALGAAKVQVLALGVIGARILPVRQYGSLMSWIGVLYICLVFADVGVASRVQRDVAARELPMSRVVVTIWCSFRFSVPLFGCVVAGLALTSPFELSSAVLAVSSLWIVLLLINGVISAAYNGNLEFGRSSVPLLTSRLISILLMAGVALGRPANTMLYLSLCLLAGEAAALVLQLIILPQQDLVKGSAEDAAPFRNLPYLVNNLSNSANSRADIPIVGYVAGHASAGYYAPASQAQSLALTIPTILSAGLLSSVARAAAEGKPANVSAISSMTRRCLRYNLVWTLVAYVVLVGTRGLWLPLFFGIKYAAHSLPIIVILLSPIIGSFHVVFGQEIVGLGHARLAARATLAALVTGIAAMLVLTRFLGPTGAACGVVIRDGVLSVEYALLLPSVHRRSRVSVASPDA